MWKLGQSIERPLGVTTYGSAVLRVEPDVAVTSLEISRVEKEPASAFQAVREAVMSVRGVLSTAGIDRADVEVSRVRVHDEFEYSPRKLVGYRASVGFQATRIAASDPGAPRRDRGSSHGARPSRGGLRVPLLQPERQGLRPPDSH
jgi:uncharacterized protein YggE